jgi:catechol 2,3-dioxygenase-like lactoylglutathione lyase family enzyme
MTSADIALTILYVAELPRATAFFDAVFGFEKTVDVPVYTEYRLNAGARLGLMPQGNSRHFLGDQLGSRRPTDGCPRAEVYLHVADLEGVVTRLHKAGATCTSPLALRAWGDRAAYFMTPDGYVIAVAARG